jgi:nucleoside-diphosphate-sugar epimerase
MRVFLAGASGVIGERLVPLLIDAGHTVAGMTRTPSKAGPLEALGAVPVVCDVFDRKALRKAVLDFDPELVVHQLTDLPDDRGQIPEFAERSRRMYIEGTPNLLAAAEGASRAPRVLAQSIAWEPRGETANAVRAHDAAVLAVGGVVIRYGRLYGPGTYFEGDPPPPPRVHVNDAARRTLDFLDAEPGVVEVS